MLTAEQRAARQSGVGGSDTPVVLGLSPWKTVVELWAEKRGLIEPENISDEDRIIFGNLLEDTVASEYARRRSVREGREIKVHRVNETLRHKQLPWLLAHIDRRVVGEKRILECKTADRFAAGEWGEEGTDEIPAAYLPQAHHYLTVTGAEACDVAVLIGGNEFRTYTVRADPEWSQLIIERDREFWRCVETGEQPAADLAAMRAPVDVVRRLYPGTNGATVVADQVIEQWRGVYDDACALRNRYEMTAELAKAHLLEFMREAAVLEFADGTRLTRKEVSRKGYEVKACSYIDARFAKAKAEKAAA